MRARTISSIGDSYRLLKIVNTRRFVKGGNASLAANRRENALIFGQHLRGLRTSRGLTQGDLAERCGTSISAISNFEAGNNMPTLGTLLRLAEAVDCKPSELIAVFDRDGSKRR